MGSCDLPAKQNNMKHTRTLLMLVGASACVEAGPVRCVLDRVVTRTSFEKGQMVEIARQVQCGHRELEEENYSSDEDDSEEDEDSSNEEDSNEDDHRDKKVESEGSSRIPTTSNTASTTHAAAAGAGDSPQEIGPVTEHVDEYNEVYDICGDLPG